MKLYLVQHAKAKTKEEDPEQSLSEEGWSDLNKVQSFISTNMNFEIKYIFHSSKTRAIETAKSLSEILRPSGGMQEEKGLKPLDDPAVWVERINKLDEDIMIVGHKPNLSKIASRLLIQEDKEIINFHQAGIICIKKVENRWMIDWIIKPGLLR